MIIQAATTLTAPPMKEITRRTTKPPRIKMVNLGLTAEEIVFCERDGRTVQETIHYLIRSAMARPDGEEDLASGNGGRESRKVAVRIKVGGLTLRQLEVLQAVAQYIEEHRVSPRIKDVASDIGRQPCSAEALLNVLEHKGMLKRTWRQSRSMQLTGEGVAALKEAEQQLAGHRR